MHTGTALLLHLVRPFSIIIIMIWMCLVCMFRSDVIFDLNSSISLMVFFPFIFAFSVKHFHRMNSTILCCYLTVPLLLQPLTVHWEAADGASTFFELFMHSQCFVPFRSLLVRTHYVTATIFFFAAAAADDDNNGNDEDLCHCLWPWRICVFLLAASRAHSFSRWICRYERVANANNR